MKKLLFMMAFVAAGMTANAETFVADEGDNTEKKSKVISDDDNWTMRFDLGINIPVSVPDGMSFAPFRSWELNWTVFEYNFLPSTSSTAIKAGLGFNWRAYTLRGHDKLFYKEDGVVKVGPRDPYMDELSSNIHTTALTIPVLLKQNFSKKFAVSVGGQFNWNYYARVHNYYETGDDEVDVYTKKIGQRKVTVDVLGIVSYGNMGIYCKWSPMSVLDKNEGPDFKSLAVGIDITL